MDKKTLFSGLVGGLVVGTGLGYFGGNRASVPTEDQTLSGQILDQQKRAPRFGETRKNIPTGKEAPSPASLDISKMGLDAMMAKYARMTPDQIQKELDKLMEDQELGYDMKSMMAIYTLAYKWGQISPKQALAYLQGRGYRKGMQQMIVMQGWAESNPENAATYFMENKKEFAYGKEALRNLVESLAKSSPESAIKWLTGMDSVDRQIAIPSILNGILKNNPDQLVAFVDKLTPEDLKSVGVTSRIAEKWASQDWDSAKKWIDKLPEEQRKSALNIALGELSKKDIEKATQEFKLLPPDQQELASYPILSNLSGDSPVKAIEWLMQNGNKDKISNMMNAAVGYTQSGSPELRSYVEKMDSGAVKDAAIDCIVRTTGYQNYSSYVDFDATMKFASQIGDEQKRVNSSEQLLNHWFREQPEKAKEWLSATSSFTPEKKQQILDNHSKMNGAESAVMFVN